MLCKLNIWNRIFVPQKQVKKGKVNSWWKKPVLEHGIQANHFIKMKLPASILINFVFQF